MEGEEMNIQTTNKGKAAIAGRGNEKPILFSGPMVRAILEGRKTQTRRIIKPQPSGVPNDPPDITWPRGESSYETMLRQVLEGCPYPVGMRLWVRETWAPLPGGPCDPSNGVIYRASEPENPKWLWKPSIFMPRWASRINLEVTEVRVQRLKDISEEDAKAEGAEFGEWYSGYGVFAEPTCEASQAKSSYRSGFGFIWENVHGLDSWELNPWVWVYTFKRI
jgi:hypothetical protein